VTTRALSEAILPRFEPALSRCFRFDLDETLGAPVEAELARISEAFDPARDFVLVSGPEEAPDGFLIAAHDDDRGGETSVLFWAVEPKARGQGVGRDLLCQAFDEVKRRGFPSLRVRCLAVSAAAARVLWDAGFRVVSTFGGDFAGRRREWILFESPKAVDEA
jgi:ribosomal protein S18 acetylase RimI-like enzyme